MAGLVLISLYTATANGSFAFLICECDVPVRTVVALQLSLC